MVTISTRGNTAYTIARGDLTKQDYDQIIPALENLIATHGSIRWYFEMQDFKGWDVSAFWRDLKFDARHHNHLEKVAMVGDKSWEKALTVIMKPFTRADVRYFDMADEQAAKSWVEH